MTDIADRVAALDAQGLSSTRIAAQLGLTQSRVEWILDMMAGATIAEPIPGTPQVPPAVKAKPTAAAVAKPAAPPRTVPVPKPRTTDPAPAAKDAAAKPINHGTPYGVKAHKKRGEKPCDECAEAYREYARGWARQNRPGKRAIEAAAASASTMPAKPVLSDIGQQVCADAAAARTAERTRVRWLVPPPGQDTSIEYGIAINGHMAGVSSTAAATYADEGSAVYARRVTAWAPIPHTGEVAS